MLGEIYVACVSFSHWSDHVGEWVPASPGSGFPSIAGVTDVADTLPTSWLTQIVWLIRDLISQIRCNVTDTM